MLRTHFLLFLIILLLSMLSRLFMSSISSYVYVCMGEILHNIAYSFSTYHSVTSHWWFEIGHSGLIYLRPENQQMLLQIRA